MFDKVPEMSVIHNRSKERDAISCDWASGIAICLAVVFFVGCMSTFIFHGAADNFTDIFRTNSFRGAMTWIKKLDWVGMLLQIVISTFSLFGVALMTIRIMTSFLYLSAKGMWEEVHDIKSEVNSGGDKDFIGLVGMAKTWAGGKHGTGLDAIIGAVLILLPDVKKYSDFGEKSGAKFKHNADDMTMSNYALEILLPTIVCVFLFAFAFNGSMFNAIAITVDGLGSFADVLISRDYAGIVNDMAATVGGYSFSFSSEGSNLGKFKQGLAMNIYGRIFSATKNTDAATNEAIGLAVENTVADWFQSGPSALTENAPQVTAKTKEGLQSEAGDNFVGNIGYEMVVNSSPDAVGAWKNVEIKDFLPSGSTVSVGDAQYLHIFLNQAKSFSGSYFNIDDNGQIQTDQ